MTLRVLVTGAGAGIGLAIAQAFLETGAETHICDVSETALADARAETHALRAWRCDVANAADVRRLYEQIDGRLDILVNNAGAGGPHGAVEELEEDAFADCVGVNLLGAFHMAKHAAARMKAQKGGVILNISTASVRTGLPNRTAYIAAKQGLMGLTANLARELGPFGVRVNAILPGAVDNARGRALIARAAAASGKNEADIEAEMLRYISMRTWVMPQDVAAMAVFLASPAARFVTGQFIGVCGGAEWEA
jgi:NAD(P)-dependent dehydrogenase (short-subunit alcohol dehydrogenase family)